MIQKVSHPFCMRERPESGLCSLIVSSRVSMNAVRNVSALLIIIATSFIKDITITEKGISIKFKKKLDHRVKEIADEAVKRKIVESVSPGSVWRFLNDAKE